MRPPYSTFGAPSAGISAFKRRCLYYNQSGLAIRKAPSTRDQGKICYAEENSDRCRSANQSDGACALMGLGARIVLDSTKGERTLPHRGFLHQAGENGPSRRARRIGHGDPDSGSGRRRGRRDSEADVPLRCWIHALVSATAWLAVKKAGSPVRDWQWVVQALRPCFSKRRQTNWWGRKSQRSSRPWRKPQRFGAQSRVRLYGRQPGIPLWSMQKDVGRDGQKGCRRGTGEMPREYAGRGTRKLRGSNIKKKIPLMLKVNGEALRHFHSP